jgi:hypothetical protein
MRVGLLPLTDRVIYLPAAGKPHALVCDECFHLLHQVGPPARTQRMNRSADYTLQCVHIKRMPHFIKYSPTYIAEHVKHGRN